MRAIPEYTYSSSANVPLAALRSEQMLCVEDWF